MMKRKIFTVLILVLATMAVYAQTVDSHTVSLTINAVALLALDDNSAITLTIGAATAGEAVSGQTLTNEKYLRYTTLVSSGSNKKITVGSDVNAPAGTTFQVTANATLGTGATVAISTTTADLVTGIGSGHTGTGAGDGAALTYVFGIGDASQLDAANSDVLTLTYTLTDQ